MKNIIIVTGGAGFVGSNLIEFLLKKTKKKIISLDNYSTGNKKNHIQNKRVKYYKLDTSQINKNFFKIKNKIHSVFHFGGDLKMLQRHGRVYLKQEILALQLVSNGCV